MRPQTKSELFLIRLFFWQRTGLRNRRFRSKAVEALGRRLGNGSDGCRLALTGALAATGGDRGSDWRCDCLRPLSLLSFRCSHVFALMKSYPYQFFIFF